MRAGTMLGLLAGLVACSRPPADVVTLGVVTGLGGVTEPCGCTSKPLGGLDRLAAQVQALAAREAAFGLLVTGDTFAELDDVPVHRLAQERQKASVIADVLATLAPLAVVRGARDRGLDETLLRSATGERRLPLFVGREDAPGREQIDRTLVTLGGLKIGVVGSPGDTAQSASAYTLAAMSMRAQGAELVIALLPESARAARPFLAELDRIDVVVTGGSDELVPPTVVDGALVVEAGDRGRYLGVLRLHRKGGGAWVYDDQGTAQRRSLEARLERLRGEVATLADGPAKAARQSKIDGLEAELRAFAPPRPTTRSITFETVTIEKAVAPAPWATQKLAAYNQSLCATLTAATAERACTPAPAPSARYVGTETCRACHAAAFTVYEQMKHAHAWATLEQAGKQCDVGCIGCHSVGFEAPGGFCRLADATTWKNVGCESCHGPGGGHVDSPGQRSAWGEGFTRARSPEVCTRCHNPEHSDQFDFSTYLPKILGPGHGG